MTGKINIFLTGPNSNTPENKTLELDFLPILPKPKNTKLMFTNKKNSPKKKDILLNNTTDVDS